MYFVSPLAIKVWFLYQFCSNCAYQLLIQGPIHYTQRTLKLGARQPVMYVAHYNSQKIQFTPERTKICIVLRSLVLLSSTSQSHTQAHAHQLEGTTNQLLKAVNLFTLCMCNQGHVVSSFTYYGDRSTKN